MYSANLGLCIIMMGDGRAVQERLAHQFIIPEIGLWHVIHKSKIQQYYRKGYQKKNTKLNEFGQCLKLFLGKKCFIHAVLNMKVSRETYQEPQLS